MDSAGRIEETYGGIMKKRIGQIVLIATIAIMLLMQVGCMSARFTHENAEGDKTTLTYLRLGKQELQGFRGQAPEGWELGFESQESQKLEVKDLSTLIIEAVRKAK